MKNDTVARTTLQRMNLREQAIAEHYQGFAADMQALANTDPEEAREYFMNVRRGELCESYGFSGAEQKKPFAFANGVAIIPVSGSLINRFGSSWGGYATGYNFIRAQHNAAMLDDDVKMIVHDHNSYGGEAAGCFELADEIFASRGSKPILAVVDSNCYSASFALATAADRVIVTPSGGVGSVGVVAMHVDMSQMLDNFGVKITYIHSGDHKVDGNPYEALSPEVKKDIKKGVDKSRAVFVSLVARNLGIDEKIVYDTEARTYRAEDALALGLIHAIAAPSAALQAYLTESEGADDSTTKPNQESSMTITPEQLAAAEQAAAAKASTDARTAEKARMSGIMGCEEAKGKEAMANHLAMNTEMTVEAAKGILAVTPAAAAAPAAVTPPAVNQFAAAMAAGTNPEVGADGAGAGGAAADKPAYLQILAAQQAATGVKLLDK